jgi:L-ascorbate metabolism protein UlaG (beta-lactamase superfamily)
MRLIKYTHACVRLEQDDRVLVIDPGVWSEPDALIGADAVLVTHEHEDHIDELRLAGLGVPVYAPVGARISRVEVTPVEPGQEFDVAGFRVGAVGGQHAIIYGGQPDCANLGYVVDGAIYHPGDSLHVPRQTIDTLLVPAQGSWLKLDEVIDFVRAIGPALAVPIHDAQLNDRGLAGVNHWISHEGKAEYRYLAPGESLDRHPK